MWPLIVPEKRCFYNLSLAKPLNGLCGLINRNLDHRLRSSFGGLKLIPLSKTGNLTYFSNPSGRRRGLLRRPTLYRLGFLRLGLRAQAGIRPLADHETI